MKIGGSVLHINMHRLTESDIRPEVTISRWRTWHHFSCYWCLCTIHQFL